MPLVRPVSAATRLADHRTGLSAAASSFCKLEVVIAYEVHVPLPGQQLVLESGCSQMPFKVEPGPSSLVCRERTAHFRSTKFASICFPTSANKTVRSTCPRWPEPEKSRPIEFQGVMAGSAGSSVALACCRPTHTAVLFHPPRCRGADYDEDRRVCTQAWLHDILHQRRHSCAVAEKKDARDSEHVTHC